ncbi:MAG: hypothetical protein KDE27_21595 [Planctomycetes bacterium]|nr:hypothetical protein [Planctomycetota bacterium]
MSRGRFSCPHCDAEVPIGAKVCRECGSDAETGWQDEEEIAYRSLDIPDGWGPEQESGERRERRARVRSQIVAVIVALAMALVAVRWFWW